MSKSACLDIDMDEWEVLVPDDDVALRLFSDELSLDPGEVIRMNHFTCPTQETKHHHHADLMPVVPLGGLGKKNSEDEEAASSPPPPPRVFVGDIGVIFTGQEVVSVSEEFPKLDTKNQELSIPRYYCPETTPYKYKFEGSPKLGEFLKMMESPKSPSTNNDKEEGEGEGEEEEYALAEGKEHKEAAAACPGANVLGWRVSGGGFGTLCSIGVAAATVCIFILGGRQQQQHHHHQNQRLQFQIYADDKRMKQVMQQATRLNQALSVVRGVPMTRAHISFGGYYDGGL